MTPYRPPVRLLMLLLMAVLAGCSDHAVSESGGSFEPQSLPTIELKLAGKPFTLQVADDDKERQKGLMFTRSMPADHGMIFVFTESAPRSFWMKNTPLDLDIVYIAADRKIVSVKTMTANNLDGTPSDGNAQYAIELNRGVARELGLSAGQVVDIPASLLESAR